MPTPRTRSLGYLLIDEASPLGHCGGEGHPALWASGVLRGAPERGLRQLRAERAHLRVARSVANAVRFHCRHRRTRRRSGPWRAASPSFPRTCTPRAPWRPTAAQRSQSPRTGASPRARPERRHTPCAIPVSHTQVQAFSNPVCRQSRPSASARD